MATRARFTTASKAATGGSPKISAPAASIAASRRDGDLEPYRVKLLRGLEERGYPAWLFAEPGMRVRSRDPRFLAASGAYLKAVAEQVRPLLNGNGGPIIAVQVENEYGSFDNDRAYMQANRELSETDRRLEHVVGAEDVRGVRRGVRPEQDRRHRGEVHHSGVGGLCGQVQLVERTTPHRLDDRVVPHATTVEEIAGDEEGRAHRMPAQRRQGHGLDGNARD